MVPWTGCSRLLLGWFRLDSHRLGSSVLHAFAELGWEEQQLPGGCVPHTRWQASGTGTLLRKGTRSFPPNSVGQSRSRGQARGQWDREAWGGRGEKESLLENHRIYHTRIAISDAIWKWCPFWAGSGPTSNLISQASSVRYPTVFGKFLCSFSWPESASVGLAGTLKTILQNPWPADFLTDSAHREKDGQGGRGKGHLCSCSMLLPVSGFLQPPEPAPWCPHNIPAVAGQCPPLQVCFPDEADW